MIIDYSTEVVKHAIYTAYPAIATLPQDLLPWLDKRFHILLTTVILAKDAMILIDLPDDVIRDYESHLLEHRDYIAASESLPATTWERDPILTKYMSVRNARYNALRCASEAFTTRVTAKLGPILDAGEWID